MNLKRLAKQYRLTVALTIAGILYYPFLFILAILGFSTSNSLLKNIFYFTYRPVVEIVMGLASAITCDGLGCLLYVGVIMFLGFVMSFGFIGFIIGLTIDLTINSFKGRYKK